MPKFNNIIIFGSSYQSIVIYKELIDLKKKVIGFCDENIPTGKLIKNTNGLKNLGAFDNLPKDKRKNLCGIIGIGENRIRQKIVKNISKIDKNFNWINLISKNAYVCPDVKIGKGTAILSGTVIRNNVNIGEHCLINSSCSIDHDSNFDDFSSCGPGVTTGGNVKVGKMSFIGIGSTIKNSIKIEENVFIGGHSYVNKNCKKGYLYFGVPIKKIKQTKLMKSQF